MKPNWPPPGSIPECSIISYQIGAEKANEDLAICISEFRVFFGSVNTWENGTLEERVYVSVADSSSKSSTEFLQLTMLSKM